VSSGCTWGVLVLVAGSRLDSAEAVVVVVVVVFIHERRTVRVHDEGGQTFWSGCSVAAVRFHTTFKQRLLPNHIPNFHPDFGCSVHLRKITGKTTIHLPASLSSSRIAITRAGLALRA